jgi:hypothetical protein
MMNYWKPYQNIKIALIGWNQTFFSIFHTRLQASNKGKTHIPHHPPFSPKEIISLSIGVN